VGYHRLLTHKSFKTSAVVQAILVFFGALHSGSPLFWVGLHRLHHTKSDSDEDPHSPIHGFWWAHTGWLVGSRSTLVAMALALSGFGQQAIILRHDILRILGRNPPTWLQACADLKKDPLLRFLDIPGVMPAVFAMQVAVSFWLGGTTGLFLLWTVHFAVTNLSWAVNSVCHSKRFGTTRYDTGEGSRDVAFLALLTAGESYHNGHHRYPRSARHAPEGGIDPSWWLIQTLVALRLAWDPKLPRAPRATSKG